MEFKIVSFALFLFISFPLISSQLPESDPFSFIKYLLGIRKGDTVQGLHNLKTYFSDFGYLSPEIDTKNDTFDGYLESAIKTYQDNYNLDPTGILDANTVAQLLKPRCGVPDIINGTNWMKSSKNHPNNHGHIHTVSHYSFFPGSPKWPRSKYNLRYTFLANVPSNARAPVTRAFNRWAANSRFTFTQTSNPNADLKIAFERRNHGDGYPFDGRGGTIAHAFAPTNGRFHYDADELYGVGAVPGRFDLETIALHEIGHLLGLGHSSIQGAIMWPQIAQGQTKGLHRDDIAGIRALYP